MKQILTGLSLVVLLVTGIYVLLYADRNIAVTFDGGDVTDMMDRQIYEFLELMENGTVEQ